MKVTRLLMVVALVLYETQRAESEKPLTMLKSMLNNLSPPATSNNERTYVVYKCGLIDGTDSGQSTLVDCVDQPLMPDGNPIPEGTGNGNKAESDGVVVETANSDSGTAEKEYEKEYEKDMNTEWLFGNVAPVEPQTVTPVHPILEDAKIGVESIKNKLIEKIHMIKTKLKQKKWPETSTIIPVYVDDTKSTVTVPNHSSVTHTTIAGPSTAGYETTGPTTAGYVTTAHSTTGYETAKPSPAGYVTTVHSTTGYETAKPSPAGYVSTISSTAEPWTTKPTTISLPPQVECLPRIYYYPVPYPVHSWTGLNYPPLTNPANSGYGSNEVYANGPNADYGNPRPTMILENTQYPNQRLMTGYVNTEQQTAVPWLQYLYDNNYSKPTHYPWTPRPTQLRPHLQPQPQPQLHQQPQPQSQLHLQPQPQPQLYQQPQPQPQLNLQQQPQPQLHLQPQSQPQLHLQSQPQSQLHLQPQPQQQLYQQPQPQPQLNLQQQPQPQLHLQPQPQPQLHLQSQPQSQLHLQPQPKPQLYLQPQPQSQLHLQPQPQSQLNLQPQPQFQPQYSVLYPPQYRQQSPQIQQQFQLQTQFKSQPFGDEYPGSKQTTSTTQPIAVYSDEEDTSRNLNRHPQPEEDVKSALNGNVSGVSVYPARGDIAYENNGAHRYTRPQEVQEVSGGDGDDDDLFPAKDRRHVKFSDNKSPRNDDNAFVMTTSASKSKITDVRSTSVAV